MTNDIENEILMPLKTKTGVGYRLSCLVLAGILGWSLFAWGWQIVYGLGVTGMNVPAFWGLYLVNFVFFIGISHAGTLLSCILRITDTNWRRPFTRLAELITVMTLPFGAMSVVVDLGRIDRVANPVLYPNMTSPIMWDVMCITTYLLTSCLYFYLALLPDIASCRDHSLKAGGFRKSLYKALSLGWSGSEQQWKTHGRLLGFLSVALVMIAVSVHTNVSFVFATTTKPGWHSTVFGIFFVAGAIYSGSAVLMIIVVLARKLFRFQGYLTENHLHYLGKFILTMTLIWGYLMAIEYLTTITGYEGAEMKVVHAKMVGRYAPLFWIMIAFCFVIPVIVLSIRRLRTIASMTVVSVLIVLGMWIERYLIIVPSVTDSYLPWGTAEYVPSWVEWSVTAGWLAGFSLFILLFVRLFPSLTIWEIKEERERAEESSGDHRSMETRQYAESRRAT